jgi:hydroxymethylpyrimidine pyrophosphatase-like HAD family hydrolase
LGYEHVRVLTVRPGQRWRRHELEALAAVVRSGGLALVTDDPPKSGGSVAKTALELERLGFGAESIVLLLPMLAGADRVPDRLHRYPSVVLPWRDWSVQAQLQPEAVEITLAGMLGPEVEVRAVERRPFASGRSARGHVQARFKAQLRDRASGDSYEREIHVKGVGLGYFGEHALAVARPLQAFFPEVIGLRDGLLYRSWLPQESRLTTIEKQGVGAAAQTVVDYAVERARALPVSEDISLRLIDRGAVWQRAGDIVARGFGRAAQFTRPLSHPLAKGLLRVPEPSVIDGSMDIDTWFSCARAQGLRKIDFDERAFSSLDVYCNDHLFDVAGWAPAASEAATALRRAYRERTGRTIDPERWLLYRLVHLAERGRDRPEPDVEVQRAMAREMQQYYRETVFADLTIDPAGPLCAFDVDWSLETRNLGFAAITPRGAYALHALARHGYRVAIATGRSIGEVRERCRAYRLIGGVAEYGAAFFDGRTDRVHDLLSTADRENLDLVRRVLSETAGIEVDRDYAYSVRAYRVDEAGRRRGLRGETITSILEADGLRDRVRAIKGAYQTDFMVNTIDKGVGLRALASELGVEADHGKTLALAFGDSGEDLPMMAMARLALAPSNADSAVRAARVRILGEPDQLGLAQAIARLIGHTPGACPTCRATPLPPRTELLLTALGAQDARGLRKVFQAFRLARSLAGVAL